MKIGLIDADLLCNGTRHPNLALLKIAGYLRDNGYVRYPLESENTYQLITDSVSKDELKEYDHFFISCVFTFTIDNPPRILNTILNDEELWNKTYMGGTGTYATMSIEEGFAEKREEDMLGLEKNPFLNTMTNKTGEHGINMRIQMPDYDLYEEYIKNNPKSSDKYYKDYEEYSIGFLTRGCFRRCPFCVNKLERKTLPYSHINDFLDNEINESTGKLKRPYIYLWDDNFLASPKWEEMLDSLIATKRPFQFRQGLDIRLLAQNRRGIDMAKKLSVSNYHGDVIFAFDNWMDRKVIENGLKIWKKNCPKKSTKLYLFCGFEQEETDLKKFQEDIAELFMRICVLMRYQCIPYVMRHEDYKKSPMPGMYVQIARWCNQPGFFRNFSFWQFCYKNQSYHETQKLGEKLKEMKTYDEFVIDYDNGVYCEVGVCASIKTVIDFLDMFSSHRNLFLIFFNMSYKDMEDKTLWSLPKEIEYKTIRKEV